jgi:hypothetical protein
VEPTGAGAVLKTTYRLSTVWKDVKKHHFRLDCATEKRWLHLDGNLEDELFGADGGRGYAFDDQRVVSNSFGIMSRTHHETLEREGLYEDQGEGDVIEVFELEGENEVSDAESESEDDASDVESESEDDAVEV